MPCAAWTKTFQFFFARTKHGKTPGFPRFRARARYDSLTYPQSGFRLAADKLHLAKIGGVRLRLSRPVEGKVKTCTIKREASGWFVVLTAEVEPKPLPPCSEAVGVDVGLRAFATLSDGTEVPNPRWYRESQAELRRAQRRVSRRRKGSKRRKKAVLLLRKIHERIRNRRADFHHKVAKRLVDNHGLVAVEDLNVKGLARTRLAKPVLDASWSAFINILTAKAEYAARRVVKVSPSGTSQTCVCGARVAKTLRERWHSCECCGLSLPRDHVSALVILNRALGQSVLAITGPAGAGS